MSDDERLAAIEVENRQWRQQLDVALTQNTLLLERVQELEARLAKDSHNSREEVHLRPLCPPADPARACRCATS